MAGEKLAAGALRILAVAETDTELDEDAGFAQPVELGNMTLAFPITAFGGVADTSSSSGGNADTSSTGTPTDPDSAGSSTGSGGSEESTVGLDGDEGDGDGCNCRTAPASGPWLLVPLFALLRRRRQPNRKPSTNLRHIASKRSISPS